MGTNFIYAGTPAELLAFIARKMDLSRVWESSLYDGEFAGQHF
jgi:hypothetical protein